MLIHLSLEGGGMNCVERVLEVCCEGQLAAEMRHLVFEERNPTYYCYSLPLPHQWLIKKKKKKITWVIVSCGYVK